MTTSFARGARYGFAVAGSTLVLMLALVVGVLATSRGGSEAEAAAALAASQAEVTYDAEAALAVRRDLARLKAEWQPEGALVRDFPFELSQDEIAAIWDAESPNSPAAVAEAAADEPPEANTTPNPTTATPRASAPSPVRTLVVAPAELRRLLAASFGSQADIAYAVVMCESSANAGANTGNGYYGMWQFDLPTWRSVGGTGLPSDASVDEQIRRARALYDARGWQPWGCARPQHLPPDLVTPREPGDEPAEDAASDTPEIEATPSAAKPEREQDAVDPQQDDSTDLDTDAADTDDTDDAEAGDNGEVAPAEA